MLVAVDLADRDKFVGEAASLLGGRPATVALKRECVLVLAGDSVALGHVLAGLAHRFERDHLLHARIREAPAKRRVPGRAVAVLRLRSDERRARHGFDAAGDEKLAVSRADRMRGPDDCRQTGRAETVHGDTGDALGQPREQGTHAGDVAVVLPSLVGGAEVDVLDRCRRYACPLHGLLDDEGGEVVRPHVRKRASVAPDGRPDRGKDDCLSHEASLAAA